MLMRALVVFCLALCISCVAAHRRELSLPRAHPGYVQWLQKQSMLAMTPELVGQVSQTERIWLNNGAGSRTEVLLNAAPTWLEFDPVAMQQQTPLFKWLQARVPSIDVRAIQGLYLGQTGERASIWLRKGASGRSDHVASLNFDLNAGDNAAFDALAAKVEAAGMQLGSGLLPAATGRGPDFLLQARHAAGFAGLYAMLEAPANTWRMLPAQGEEWDALLLDDAAVAHLVEAGVLPSGLLRDKIDWLERGGWAATGEIMGSDGMPRRWLYRYADMEGLEPVLMWQDPSGLARQIFSAAIIRSTGLQGQTLLGLHMEAIMGLEPAGAADASSLRQILSPGIEALAELASQAHRYGGWTMQADPLPLPAMAAVLAGPCDFCRDALSPLLAVCSLQEGAPGPLADFYQACLDANLPIARLAHGFNDWQTLQPRILAAQPENRNRLARFGGRSHLDMQTLQQQLPDVTDIHNRFFLPMALGQPGLAFVGMDLPANTELDKNTKSGKDTPRSLLQNLLHNRKQHDLANGVLTGISRGEHSLGVFFRLPSGNYWVLAINFGKKKERLAGKLPAAIHGAEDVSTGRRLFDTVYDGSDFTLSLDGYKVRNVVFFVN